MAVSSISTALLPSFTSFAPLNSQQSSSSPTFAAFSPHNSLKSSRNATYGVDKGNCERRSFLFGVGTLSLNLPPSKSSLAEEVPKNYEKFVDLKDGYSYYFPSDWIDFDFRGHDSAFKDRYLQLQNVRLSFIPTSKSDIHEMGPIEEVVPRLVNHVYAAPDQTTNIYDMKERSIDGKNYYTFEYLLRSPSFGRAAFATVAVGNGRLYTLVVGANERRWRRVRNKLKIVADSFRLLLI